jgi:hypothetical protein
LQVADVVTTVLEVAVGLHEGNSAMAKFLPGIGAYPLVRWLAGLLAGKQVTVACIVGFMRTRRPKWIRKLLFPGRSGLESDTDCASSHWRRLMPMTVPLVSLLT